MTAGDATHFAELAALAIIQFLTTFRSRAKMGEVQAERQKPVIDTVETLKSKIDAKDSVLLELTNRVAAIERVSRRTEIAVKGGEMEEHTNPFGKSHAALLIEEVKRRNKK